MKKIVVNKKEAEQKINNSEKYRATNLKQNYDVDFSNDLSNGKILSLKKGNHILQMSFDKRQNKNVRLKKTDNKYNYADAENGIDLEYQTEENKIKESVIIKERQDKYEYHFTLQIGDLKPIFKNNQIELKKGNKTIYKILSPYMEDKNKVRSDDCRYEVTKLDESLELSLICDENWINDEKRVFPVVVDPTIEIINDTIFTIKHYINEEEVADENFCVGKIEHPSVNESAAIDETHTLKLFIDIQTIRLRYNNLHKLSIKLPLKDMANISFYAGFNISMNNLELANYTKEQLMDCLYIDISSFLINSNQLVLELNPVQTRRFPRGYVHNFEDLFKFYNFSNNVGPTPELIFEFEDENWQETTTYALDSKSKTIVNIIDGSYKFETLIAKISNNSKTLNIKNIFNSKQNNNTYHLGNCWKTNFHQQLIKSSFNTALGGNDITYVDGDNKKHVFAIKWFYINNDGKKKYISKDNVYINDNEELTCLINDVEYEVKIETTNSEGMQIVSGATLITYAQKPKSKKTYYAQFGSCRRQIDIDGDNNLQFYYLSSETGEKVYVGVNDIYNTNGVYKTISTGEYLAIENSPTEIIQNQDGTYNFKYKTGTQNGPKQTYSDGVITCVEEADNQEALEDIYLNDDILSISHQIDETKKQIESINSSKNLLIFNYNSLLNQMNIQLKIIKDVENILENQDVVKIAQNSLLELKDNFYDVIGNSCLTQFATTPLQEYDPSDNEFKDIVQHFYISPNTLSYLQYPDFNLAKEAKSVINVFENYYNAKVNALSNNSEYTHAETQVYEKNKLVQQKNNLKAMKETYSRIEQFDQEYFSVLKTINDSEMKLESLYKRKSALIYEQKKKPNDLIIDKDGNVLGFDGYGNLVLIQDKYENKIKIEYSYDDMITSVDSKLVSIYTDTQKVVFTYDEENGLLNSLTDSSGKVTKFYYDENNNLIKIVRPSHSNLSFFYESGFSAINSLKQKILLGVSTNNALSVKEYVYNGTISKNTLDLPDNQLKNITDHRYVFADESTTFYDLKQDHNNPVHTYYFKLGRNIMDVGIDLTKVKYYARDKLIQEASFKTYDETTPATDSPVIEYLPIYNGNYTYTVDLSESSLVSNLLGLRVDVATGDVDEDTITYLTLKAIVNTCVNNVDTTETFEQTYQEMKLQTVVLPIVVDRNNTTSITIEIDTNSQSNNYVMALDLIYLNDGRQFEYDLHDRLIKERNAKKIIEYSDFNSHDLPLSKIEIDEFRDRLITHYSYDNNNLLTSITNTNDDVIECHYDDKGNCIEKCSYNKKDASLTKKEIAGYDEKGRLQAKSGLIMDKTGAYPKEEIYYLPNSNINSKIKSVNGEKTIYNYDFNTGQLLSLSSSIDGINNSTSFTYTFGLLTSMSHHGVTINYTYDGTGRKIDTYLNDDLLPFVHNEYNDNYYSANSEINDGLNIHHGKYQKSVYKDGLTTEMFINNKGQLLKTIFTDDDYVSQVTYSYNGDKIEEVIASYPEDSVALLENITYQYNEDKKIIVSYKEVNNESQYYTSFVYDYKGRLSHEETEINDSDVVELNYTYDDNNRVASATFAFATPILQDFEYDVLNRVTHQELKQDKLTICHEYSYLQQDENTIDLVSEDINKIKVTTNGETTYMIETNSYTYDVCGNIISIETDESTTRYKYDKLNRLIREDNPLLDKSIVYKYDKSGNVVSKKTYSYTLDDKLYSASVIDEYTYSCDGWKDQLIDYNGKSFVYDNMGRPTTYMDNELEWNKKGELTYALTKDKEIEYFYDAQSIRRKKIVDGVETKYITDGSKILEIISTDENGNQLYKIIYHYALDKLVGFCYSNNGISKEYIYDRNIFGDITSIYDSEGVIIAKYVYDAYGKVTVLNSQGEPDSNINSIGNINPFRYRGYYFDSETGFYYLNSRYYDPETGRFISPDILTILDETKGQINGLNLYMYCGDNPVMRVDPNGYDFWSVFRRIGKSLLVVGGLFMLIPVLNLVGLGLALLGTIMLVTNDIYQIVSENVYFDGNKIVNSSNLSLPTSIFLYSAYLKYWSPQKDYFEGSATGIASEWLAHNIAYDVFSVLSIFTDKFDNYINQAKEVNLGKTIFTDQRLEVVVPSAIIEFAINPFALLFDVIVELFYK